LFFPVAKFESSPQERCERGSLRNRRRFLAINWSDVTSRPFSSSLWIFLFCLISISMTAHDCNFLRCELSNRNPQPDEINCFRAPCGKYMSSIGLPFWVYTEKKKKKLVLRKSSSVNGRKPFQSSCHVLDFFSKQKKKSKKKKENAKEKYTTI
jgi:hypothetical protein